MPDRYAVWLDRDVLTASGPEATEFLQGQLSQDLLGIGQNESAWSFALSPQGKIDALVRVTRLAGDDWVLDTDAGWGDALVQRLNRFKLRTKVDIERVPWGSLGLRGVGARASTVEAASAVVQAWPGVDGVDALGADLSVPTGWDVLGGSVHESARILSGMPRMGAELDEKTIPGETGIVPLTVSFTKGCYTGQELVARVDSRGGNVPRRLRLMRLPAPVAPGTELLLEDGATAGNVTSVAPDGSGGWVALGYTKRGVDVPGIVLAASSDSETIEVSVEELPV